MYPYYEDEFEENSPRTGRFRHFLIAAAAAGFIFGGAGLLWAATLPLPSIEAIQEARLQQSTKIYDRTGEVLLYDFHQNIRRTIVPLDQISPNIKNATIAIEDANFYHHYGFEPTAILRALWKDITTLQLQQGGSTITQQVVKNSILDTEKKISRKLKEIVLAIKLERELSKDDILQLYLNVIPYGGNKYGIEEASMSFLGKHASEVTIAEAAYLAALPQATTYYSPYGNHVDALKRRKDLVLDKMLEHGMITKEEHDTAQKEDVKFLPPQSTGIKAPHFVFYVVELLQKKYGEQALEEGGYKIVTSLDWKLQSEAEKIVYSHAIENANKYNASNAALVAMDPKTGQILSMVGSRDYFDTSIDGNYNITLASRQPGSSFKPFVYAAAFLKGYTPETTVFDVPTQFSTGCNPDNFTSQDGCYSPQNYDNAFRGPMTLRNALAQSVNIPAVKVLYLAGIKNSLDLASKMGVTTLGDYKRYGLTLVLGGGEVTLLDMTHAYGAFANEGKQVPINPILKIVDKAGKMIEEYDDQKTKDNAQMVLDRQVALQITDILSDNTARTPAFGSNSYLLLPGYDVAVKTGTTNEYRDAWVIGYTPDIVVGAWSGNNDNSPMQKKVAGFIVAPLWNEFLSGYLKEKGEVSRFPSPDPIPYNTLKPVLRGVWQGNQSYVVDKISGALATDDTPPELRETRYIPNVHSILYWVNRDNPRGAVPDNPLSDPQYPLWEYGVQRWLGSQSTSSPVLELDGTTSSEEQNNGIPTQLDAIHKPEYAPRVEIRSPEDGAHFEPGDRINIRLRIESKFDVHKADFFVNSVLVGSTEGDPSHFTFIPQDVNGIKEDNTLTVIVYDEKLNKGQASIEFKIRR